MVSSLLFMGWPLPYRIISYRIISYHILLKCIDTHTYIYICIYIYIYDILYIYIYRILYSPNSEYIILLCPPISSHIFPSWEDHQFFIPSRGDSVLKHRSETNRNHGGCRSMGDLQDPIDWRYLPYIRPSFEAYVRGYIPKISPEMWYSTSILGSWNSE